MRLITAWMSYPMAVTESVKWLSDEQRILYGETGVLNHQFI